MLKRVLSGLIGTPLLVYVVYEGGVLLYSAVMLIGLMALYEFYNSFRIKGYRPIYFIGYFISVLILSDFFLNNNYLLPLLVTLFFICGIIMLSKEELNIIDVMITFIGVIYITVFLGHIILVSKLDVSIGIWLIFIIAFFTDTFAYFSGYLFGKNKLCPTISPKKTVEGSIGGIVGSVLGSLIFGYIFLEVNLIYLVLLGIIGSIIAQIGDLVASKIKRFIDIKDFGKIMPGHGGILDRFDSIIFVAPIVYYFLVYFI